MRCPRKSAVVGQGWKGLGMGSQLRVWGLGFRVSGLGFSVAVAVWAGDL